MRGPELDLLIIEQMDPEHAAVGGIEGMISDIARLEPSLTIGIIGISRTGARPGSWRRIEYQGRMIWFFAAARVRPPRPRRRLRVPQSLRLTLGAFLHRPRPVAKAVHVHRAEYGAVLSFLRVPYTLYLHNGTRGLLGGSSDSLWRYAAPAYRWMERRSVTRAAAVGVFNGEHARRLRAIRPDLQRLFTWYDSNLFHPAGAPKEHSSTVEVLWAGRFDEQKDPFLAVRATATAAGRIRLRMVGDGVLAPDVQSLVEQQGLGGEVVLAEGVPKPAVADLMRAADVFLITSHYEGSPTVVAEAMASGLPVVATREADPDGAITDAINGFVLHDREAEHLGRALVAAAALDRGRVAEEARGRSAEQLVPRMLAVGGTVLTREHA